MKKTTENAIVKQVQATPVLVENVNNQAFTTSLKITELFGLEHKNVLASIRDRVAEISADPPVDGYNPIFIASTYTHEQNKQEYPMYLLNRDAFTDTVMNLNTAKARAFKRQFIAAFNKMESEIAEAKAKRAAELATIKANKSNPIWLPIRQSTKTAFKALTDVIKNELIPLAKLQGSSHYNFFYVHYSSLIKTAAGVKDITDRDILPADKLQLIYTLQNLAITCIRQGVESGTNYQMIYEQTKRLIEKFVENNKLNQPSGEISLF